MKVRDFPAACLLALTAASLGALPARAETPAELDALSRATDQPGSGVALARRQIASGELLDALATLERVILNHPEDEEARLLHAGVTCSIDDRRGALVELDVLRGREFSDSLWDEATADCSRQREG
ncbi:MAG: hypothetical protein H6917_07770 [Novosphingobium sp.]|nr:hypothetical protein [Novosphingobium sp.]MCP5402272.1 hypothetical protein [Novosphingobium sp.]